MLGESREPERRQKLQQAVGKLAMDYKYNIIKHGGYEDLELLWRVTEAGRAFQGPPVTGGDRTSLCLGELSVHQPITIIQIISPGVLARS